MESIEYLQPLNIKVCQDDDYYCFSSDSLLLAKFATAKSSDIVADFCSGSGVVGFDFFSVNSKLVKSVDFFEMQKPLFDLSVKSINLNGLGEIFKAHNTRLQDIKSDEYGKYSLILCNPPYMKKDAGEVDKSESIALCKSELAISLKEVIFAIGKCLKFGGRCAMVHRTDRLVDVISEMKNNGIEPKRLQFVLPKENKPAYLFLIEGVKGGKSGIKVLSDIIN